MLYLLALHIIFVVTWFAGLFYIVRLFVYHSEANEKPQPDRGILKKHFTLAEKRLWYGITWPSAVATYIFGTWLLIVAYGNNIPGWLWLKLAFVFLLTVYHFICHRIFLKYQKDEIRFTGMKIRIWNEVATLFLVVIVFIVVLKDISNWMKGAAGLIIFSLILMAAIKGYEKIRRKNEN